MNRFLRSTIVIAATCAWTNAQAAALGENISSNSSLQAKVSAQSTSNMKTSTKTSSLGASYTVREMNDGVRTIQEYVDASGVVFAIRWEGNGLPKFSNIFGQYYSKYKAALSAKSGARNLRFATFTAGDMIYSNFSFNGVMKGVAYVPKLFPSGLAIEDIQ